MEPDESLENTLAGEHGIAADFVSHRKLQQTGGKQQKKEAQTIFSDDVGPPNQLAAALGQRHENYSPPQRLEQIWQWGQRRLLERREDSPGRRLGHARLIDALNAVFRQRGDERFEGPA